MRIKTTVPPPIYISSTPFSVNRNFLHSKPYAKESPVLNGHLSSTTRALVERRYFESS